MASKKKEEASLAPYVIGVDLGGTKVLAAVVDHEGRIIARSKFKTHAKQGPHTVIQRIVEAAQQAVHKANVDEGEVGAMGIGAPGPVDPDTGIIDNPPNLPGWDEVALGPLLSEALGMPVFLENDVNLGTLGEHNLGAGRGTKDMIGIFVGTGIGGGLILDGKLRSGYRHAAAEIGHMILLADGPVCGCGRRGCAEALASRTAIDRDLQIGIAAGRESLLPDLTAGANKRISSGLLAKALNQGDPLVAEVLSRVQWYLGLLTASLVNLIDPEIVVFGGGLIEALGAQFLAPIKVTAQQYYIQKTNADKVRIVAATLGDDAGVLGAAVLARQKSGSD
jgi:glucokinase